MLLIDNAYSEKVESLEQINRELADNYDLLDVKTREHQSLAIIPQTNTNMTQQIKMITGLEWEATSKARITNELLTALEKQTHEKNAIISLLETELQKRNDVIALKEAEENPRLIK